MSYSNKADIVLLGGQSSSTLYTVSPANQLLSRICAESGYKSFPIEHFFYALEFDFDRLVQAVLLHTDQDTLALGISTTLLQRRPRKNNDKASNHDWWWGSAGKDLIVNFIGIIKQQRPNIKVIVGGSQVELAAAARLSAIADYAVTGQAENALPAILKHLRSGSPLVTHVLEGVSFVKHDDYKYEDFSSLSWMPISHQPLKMHSQYALEVARGCVFKCAFCTYELAGKAFNDFTRPLEKIRQDIIDNYNKYRIQIYTLIDDTIVDSKEKMELLRGVFKGLPFDVYWGGYFRLDLFLNNPEWAAELEEMGCRGVFFGIETLHKEAGAKVGKGLGKERIISTLEAFRKYAPRIHIKGSFIFGLPHETLESMEWTHKWLCETDLIDSASYHPLQVANDSRDLSFTSKMQEDPTKYGLVEDGKMLHSQSSAFASYPDSVKWVNERKAEYRKCKPTYKNLHSWFYYASDVNLIVQTGRAANGIEGYNFLVKNWFPIRSNTVVKRTLELANQLKAEYYTDILAFVPDFSSVQEEQLKKQCIASAKRIIPINVEQ